MPVPRPSCSPESGTAPGGVRLPDEVEATARRLDRLPSYVYDLAGLREHAAAVRERMRDVEVFYAAKANPDPLILRALAPYVAGFEVASGGELEHVAAAVPAARLAFGGPGKGPEELAAAVRLGVERVHVESPTELGRLIAIARRAGRPVDVLLRANLELPVDGAALTMSGPFGMDERALASCRPMLDAAPMIRVRGVHAHLASGLSAPQQLGLARRIVGWAADWLGEHFPRVAAPEINLGGGMAVDYADPAGRFDWAAYGRGLRSLAPAAARLRIEPGRALTVYHGWYVTEVLDVKYAHGRRYLVVRGGTHHMRTPATKNHDQPFALLPMPGGVEAADPAAGGADGGGPEGSDLATVVGQLCTPKDVLATDVPLGVVRVGDRLAFAMAGAYAWNISHHDFLMHPAPGFVYL